MRRLVVLGIAAVLTGLIVGVVVASSGDEGGGGDRSRSIPELAPLPGSSDLGSGTRSERTDTDTTTTNDSGGTSAPDAPPAGSDGSGGTQAPEDSEQNDTPPPSGSPAERFEQFCQENPGAC
ncbi:MAG: hypothetical protein ACRDLQ_05815 [Solirubrobacterales bacterium]